MPNFTPTWETIAASIGAELKNVAGIKHVTDRYPDNAIAATDLAWAVFSEPEFSIVPITFGAAEAVYTGTLYAHILAIPLGQAELSNSDKSLCRNLGLTIQLYMHNKRMLQAGTSRLYLSFEAAQLAKLSPYDSDTRGHYAGIVMPYSVRVAYSTGT